MCDQDDVDKHFLRWTYNFHIKEVNIARQIIVVMCKLL